MLPKKTQVQLFLSWMCWMPSANKNSRPCNNFCTEANKFLKVLTQMWNSLVGKERGIFMGKQNDT